MKKELEDYLTDSEKKVMQILKENYEKTRDKELYQTAQELLSVAEARRSPKHKKELPYDYI